MHLLLTDIDGYPCVVNVEFAAFMVWNQKKPKPPTEKGGLKVVSTPTQTEGGFTKIYFGDTYISVLEPPQVIHEQIMVQEEEAEEIEVVYEPDESDTD
jgi:hypothetical protein